MRTLVEPEASAIGGTGQGPVIRRAPRNAGIAKQIADAHPTTGPILNKLPDQYSSVYIHTLAKLLEPDQVAAEQAVIIQAAVTSLLSPEDLARAVRVDARRGWDIGIEYVDKVAEPDHSPAHLGVGEHIAAKPVLLDSDPVGMGRLFEWTVNDGGHGMIREQGLGAGGRGGILYQAPATPTMIELVLWYLGHPVATRSQMVVGPTPVGILQQDSGVKHTNNTFNIGFKAKIQISASEAVSLHWAQWSEGVCPPLVIGDGPGAAHVRDRDEQHKPGEDLSIPRGPADASLTLNGKDTAYSTFGGISAREFGPDEEVKFIWAIPWRYRVESLPGSSWTEYVIVNHQATARRAADTNDGTMRLTKGGVDQTTKYSSPTSDY